MMIWYLWLDHACTDRNVKVITMNWIVAYVCVRIKKGVFFREATALKILATRMYVYLVLIL